MVINIDGTEILGHGFTEEVLKSFASVASGAARFFTKLGDVVVAGPVGASLRSLTMHSRGASGPLSGKYGDSLFVYAVVFPFVVSMLCSMVREICGR